MPQIPWNTGLIVVRKARNPSGQVGPFRETFAPPCVIFGNGMKLRQIIGQNTGAADGASG